MRIFACGQDGCDIIEENDSDVAMADELMKGWARKQRLKTGHYPSMEDQETFWATALEDVKQRRKKKRRSP